MTHREFGEKAVADLLTYLGAMHRTLYELIAAFGNTELSAAQRVLLTKAYSELLANQERFLAKYEDVLSGAERRLASPLILPSLSLDLEIPE